MPSCELLGRPLSCKLAFREPDIKPKIPCLLPHQLVGVDHIVKHLKWVRGKRVVMFNTNCLAIKLHTNTQKCRTQTHIYMHVHMLACTHTHITHIMLHTSSGPHITSSEFWIMKSVGHLHKIWGSKSSDYQVWYLLAHAEV
jgi:hypothetical protein